MFNETGDAGTKGDRRLGRTGRTLRSFALGVLGLVALGVVGALGLEIADDLAEFEAFMKAIKPWLHGVQLLGVVGIWACWPRLIRRLADRGCIGRLAVEPLLRARHRVLVILLLMVLVAMGLPGSLSGTPVN